MVIIHTYSPYPQNNVFVSSYRKQYSFYSLHENQLINK
jgi:hypothetical protein